MTLLAIKYYLNYREKENRAEDSNLKAVIERQAATIQSLQQDIHQERKNVNALYENVRDLNSELARLDEREDRYISVLLAAEKNPDLVESLITAFGVEPRVEQGRDRIDPKRIERGLREASDTENDEVSPKKADSASSKEYLLVERVVRETKDE